MSDRFPSDTNQDETPLTPDLARLHTLLLREGERWRHDEPSTARLERHVQALAQRDASARHNGHEYTHGREDTMLAERNPVHHVPAPHDAAAERGVRSRGRGLLPAAAAVLLVALAGATFAIFGPGHAGPGRVMATATPAVTHVIAVRPAQTQLPLPANGYLSGISFSSAHDGWAVGGIRVPDLAGQDFSGTHTVLIHYHDGVWTASSETIPNAALSDVAMTSADDGWAVGMTNNDPATNTGGTSFLLHYTGGHWQRVDPPALKPTGNWGTAALSRIRMLSPDFGYITGAVNVMLPGTNTVDTRLLLLVYQHGTWTSIPNIFEAYGVGVVMVSPSEGWATTGTAGPTSNIWSTSDAEPTSAFYHYLNGVWTKTATYNGLANTMYVAAPGDIWAVGMACKALGQCTSLIYHYDGTAWSPVAVPVIQGFKWANLGITAITTEAAGIFWYSLASIDLSQGPAWHYQEYLYTYTHGVWTHQSLPLMRGEIMALTTEGNGGTWAIVMADNPLAMTILYSSGNGWSIYGHS